MVKAPTTLSTKEMTDLIRGDTTERVAVIEARVGKIDAVTFIAVLAMSSQSTSAPAPAFALAAAPAAAAADDDQTSGLADSASNAAGRQALLAKKEAAEKLCLSTWCSRTDAVTALRVNASQQGAKLRQLMHKRNANGMRKNVGGQTCVELRWV